MRTRFFSATIAIVGIVLFVRLFFLQIISDQYGDLSLKNSVLKQYVYPERGYVFDRNGTLLVSNQPMYDLMVIPKNLEPFDTLDLCKMLRLPKSELVERINKARRYSLRAPSVLKSNFKTRLCHFTGDNVEISRHVHTTEICKGLPNRSGSQSLGLYKRG